MNKHGQGACPTPTNRVRIVGDADRSAYSLCDDCLADYSALGLVFVPVDAPEWTIRAREARLPMKVAAA